MKFFENRAVATIIAVTVVIVSMLLGARAHLVRDCQALEETFFEVSSGKAPNYYVNQILSASASLVNVGDHYAELSEPTEALRSARTALFLAEKARDISDIYEAFVELDSAAETFRAAAAGVAMSDYDSQIFADNASVMAGAARELRESAYNDTVTEYLHSYYRFPTYQFARLFHVAAPELFA